MTQVFPHQKAVFTELLRTAKTFCSGTWKGLPVRPRFNRLVVGESGSGKSFLGRALGTELKIPVWDCICTNWIPLGCSEWGARPTWLDVVDFIATNDDCIILLDEVDKLGTETTPWMTCVRTEIFGLLDGQIPVNLLLKTESWEEDEKTDLSIVRTRLNDSVFVIGAGTFQTLWDHTPSTTIGFGGKSITTTEQMHLRRLTEILPMELLNRFAPPVLALSPLLESDYKKLLTCTLHQMNGAQRHIAKAVGKRTMSAAIRDRLGCRYVELIMLETAGYLAELSSASCGVDT